MSGKDEPEDSPRAKQERPTIEQIRRGIDSGRSGEEAPYPDPAAALLGSDDEAAGYPASPEARRLEEEHQRATPVDHRSGGKSGEPGGPTAQNRFVKIGAVAAGLVVLFLLIVLL